MPKFAVRLSREATYTEYADLNVMAADSEQAMRIAKIRLGEADIAYKLTGLDWESTSDDGPNVSSIAVDEDAEGWPRELPR